MVNPTRVAVLERIDNLNEYALDQLILSEEREFSDNRVKIASTQVVDKKGIAARIDLTVECEYVGMGRDSGVELLFAGLVMI